MPVDSSHPALERFVAKATQLYTLPAVAVQVLQLTCQPEVELGALKKCLENDPALTGKVLRVVNSSLFGLTRAVSDLNEALTMLGTKPLKLLVLGFSLPDSLFVNVAGDILRRYWRRTLTKAVAARELSQSIWKLPGDEAFLAALLEDVGVLVLLQELREPYVKLLDLAYSKAPAVGPFEAKSIGFDHREITARLLEAWGLPVSLSGSSAIGQTPEQLLKLPMAERSLPQILHLAELLAGLVTENRSDLLPTLLEDGSRFHHLTHTQLAAMVNTLQERVEELADVLVIELPAGRDYRSVLLDAHAQMSLIAADAASEYVKARASDVATDSEALLGEVQTLSAAIREATRSAPRMTAKQCGTEFKRASAEAASSETSKAPAANRQLQPPAQATAPRMAGPEPISGPHAPRPRNGTAAGNGGIDPSLMGALANLASTCRQSRCPLSLLLVEIDKFGELVLTRSAQGAQRLVGMLGNLCRESKPRDAICWQIRDDRFAIVLPEHDRQGSVEFGNQLLAEIRKLGAAARGETKPAMTVSIGVAAMALPPKNFVPQDLFDSSERCLHGAQRCGGNALKSIELY